MQPVNYNEISKIYDDVREADIVLINHFLQELPPDDGLNILDIGCGTGNYTDLFQKATQTKHYQVYGIEPSEGMIRKARQKTVTSSSNRRPQKISLPKIIFSTLSS